MPVRTLPKVSHATAFGSQADVSALKRYRELAKICSVAYKSAIRHDYLSYEDIIFFGQRIVHGSLGRGYCRVFFSRDYVVVAFRGTREMQDWTISNLKCWPVRMLSTRTYNRGAGFVHRGFQDTLYFGDKTAQIASFDAAVHHVVEALKNKKARLVITGHFLGGALALLFTGRLVVDFPDLASSIDQVVTFGTPAVGFSQFKNLIDAQPFSVVRVVNEADLVTFAPPAFYRHVGVEVWLTKAQIKLGTTWHDRLSGFLKSPIQAYRNHDIHEYLVALDRNIADLQPPFTALANNDGFGETLK